jgi:hypothetical protein
MSDCARTCGSPGRNPAQDSGGTRPNGASRAQNKEPTLDDQAPGGRGLPGNTRDDGERRITGVRRRAGTGRAPGSVLIAVAAWLLALTGGGALFVSFTAQYAYILAVRRQDVASVIEALLLDLLMIVFTLLALGLSRAGQSARAERALILACAAASAYMNVSAADVASPRSVTAYAVAPVALAVVVDRVVAVIRRHVLADREPSTWATVGRAAAAAGRIAGLVGLYTLRFALAAPQTAHGLRRMLLDAAPLPTLAETPAPEDIEPPRTKKAILLALYRAHPDYGDRSRASRVAAELAAQAGLQPGTARSYLYAELDGRPSLPRPRPLNPRPTRSARAWRPWPCRLPPCAARSVPSTNGSTKPGSTTGWTWPPGSRN